MQYYNYINNALLNIKSSSIQTKSTIRNILEKGAFAFGGKVYLFYKKSKLYNKITYIL
jgi:hypothetical protein